MTSIKEKAVTTSLFLQYSSLDVTIQLTGSMDIGEVSNSSLVKTSSNFSDKKINLKWAENILNKFSNQLN